MFYFKNTRVYFILFLDGTPRAFQLEVNPLQEPDVNVTEIQKYKGFYVLQVCKNTAIWKKAEIGRLPNWTHAIIFNQTEKQWELHENTIPLVSLTKRICYCKTGSFK